MTIIRKNVYEKRGKTFETNKEMLDKYTQMITTLTEHLKLIMFKRGGGGHLPPPLKHFDNVPRGTYRSLLVHFYCLRNGGEVTFPPPL